MQTSSIAIQREIDRVGGERIAAGDTASLWRLGDGRLVIETNGDPVWENDAGFSTAACEIVAQAGYSLDYDSAEWRELAELVQWNGIWPIIDQVGQIDGRITDGEDGFLNVEDEAMIDEEDARLGGWRIDREEGRATRSEPVLVEVARCDETIRDRGGIDEFAGLEHPAIAEACAAYHRAASAVIDDAGGRLAWSSPLGNRVLHSQWCGAQWGYSSGAIGTMARDLTAEEKATISAAADAGLEAARRVIEEADAQIAAADDEPGNVEA